MKKGLYINKTAFISVFLSLLLVVACFLLNLNSDALILKKAGFCNECGYDLTYETARLLKEKENVYLVNKWQIEARQKAGKIEVDYDSEISNGHLDPATHKICSGPQTGSTSNTSCKGYLGYYDTTPFPVITLTSSKITYTGGNVEPSFKVTFNGKEIAKSNYDYYYSYTFSDSAPRAYSYCSQMSKSIKEPGTYYLYVMFNPNNTCGPDGTTFLGRIEAQFEIVNGSVDPDSGSGGGNDGGKSSGGNNGNGGSSNSTGGGSNNSSNVPSSTSKSGEWKGNSTGWWYQYSDGSYASNKWEKISGKWYYFGSSGYMTTGWKQIGNKWYYFDSNGSMKTGWVKSGSNWYYLCSDGTMDYSEYRDGYWLNADGSWNTSYSGGHWDKNSNGWWYEDNGWYPKNEWLWVNGKNYHFNGSGYCTNP